MKAGSRFPHGFSRRRRRCSCLVRLPPPVAVLLRYLTSIGSNSRVVHTCTKYGNHGVKMQPPRNRAHRDFCRALRALFVLAESRISRGSSDRIFRQQCSDTVQSRTRTLPSSASSDEMRVSQSGVLRDRVAQPSLLATLAFDPVTEDSVLDLSCLPTRERRFGKNAQLE